MQANCPFTETVERAQHLHIQIQVSEPDERSEVTGPMSTVQRRMHKGMLPSTSPPSPSVSPATGNAKQGPLQTPTGRLLDHGYTCDTAYQVPPTQKKKPHHVQDLFRKIRYTTELDHCAFAQVVLTPEIGPQIISGIYAPLHSGSVGLLMGYSSALLKKKKRSHPRKHRSEYCKRD